MKNINWISLLIAIGIVAGLAGIIALAIFCPVPFMIIFVILAILGFYFIVDDE